MTRPLPQAVLTCASCDSEETSHSPAHQVCQDRYDNRHACNRARLCSQNYISDVAQQIDNKQSHGEPVAPPSAAPQAQRCQSTTHADSEHQNNSPSAHTCKRFVC